MNKKILFASIISVFVLAIFAHSASAYYGYDGYENTYYEKSSSGYYGDQYVRKEVRQDPWGKTTSYVKTEDYGSQYRYFGRDGNRVTGYWSNGPYSTDRVYLGYGWDDSYRRNIYDTQYNDYYYQPRYSYNGEYYNWHGNEPNCNNRYGRCDW